MIQDSASRAAQVFITSGKDILKKFLFLKDEFMCAWKDGVMTISLPRRKHHEFTHSYIDKLGDSSLSR